MNNSVVSHDENTRNVFRKKIKSLFDIAAKRKSFTSLISWAISLSRPYKKYVVVIILGMMLETLMGLALPWPLKIILDNVVDHQPLPKMLGWLNKFFPGENLYQLAAIAAISYIIITAIGALGSFLDNYYNEKVAQYIANDLRRKMYHHLQHLSLAYYDSHQTGNLLSTLTGDVSTIQDFASTTLLSILIDCLTILGMIGIMFYLDPEFTLVALAVTPFLLFFISYFKKAMKRATREVRKDQSNMLIVMQKGLESIRAVNAYGREDFEEDRLKKVSIDTLNAAMKARRVKSSISPVVSIIISVCTAFVLWRGADLVLRGVMTIGALTIFISYIAKFFSPVKDLAKMTSTIAQVTVALERVEAILKTDAVIPQKSNAFHPGKLIGDIVFDKVSFSYNPEIPIIRNFSLGIRCGERVGICGPTGCGKSTIVSLIARFYDPVSGRILIDGSDISDFTIEGLREQIGFVLQDTVLFYGTIRENIAYGKPDSTEAEIIEAATLANAMEFIDKLPCGLDTIVGERGVTLSGGQRQRIAIARAVIRNSPILILDEPTSSLDAESEKMVMEGMENLMTGRTVIIIAHRLATIKNADKIIVVNNGVIAEEGTHDELIRNEKIYAEMYNAQM
ncbi:MAG: ABC transporter ATP-binding protein [Bacteroidetes bacterium]|nr:ABC transporter ATP-binding protein [Bacteroidota bacterium]